MTKEKIIDEMDRAVPRYPAWSGFSQPIRDNVLESISQIDGQIVIKIAGDDLVDLKKTVQAIEREIRQVQGVYRAEIDRPGDVPHLLIEIDRARAARAGLNVGDVQDVIEAALAAQSSDPAVEGERKFAVAVRLPEDRRAMANLATIPIATPDGGYVCAGAVANIRESTLAQWTRSVRPAAGRYDRHLHQGP